MENISNWREAGKIAATALEFGRGLVLKGANMREVCDAVDAKIVELGGIPAFPTQISLDHIAAHFAPLQDEDIILEDQVVKLDCGACFKGAIGDTACTIDLSGEYTELLEAAKLALADAIAVVKAGVAIGEIGKAVQNAIQSKGFSPIVNLSGHGLGEFQVHAPPTIPNFDNGDMHLLKEGMIFAIEPFATTGVGRVKEVGVSTLFSQLNDKPIRSPNDREVLSKIKSFNKLPFTTRWLTKDIPAFKVNMALLNLSRNGNLESHPPLADEGKGIVAQAEHTVLVTKEGCEILTKV